jgi:hypothetical protein
MIRGSRFVYLGASWLFVLGVMTQVFLAGMVVVARKISWNDHISLGHILAGPLLFMLVSMYLGRLPKDTKWLTWLLFVNYALQADVLIFLRLTAPVLSALHPVLALVDFALGVALARRAWGTIRQPAMRPVMQAEVPVTGSK